jgi:uncharacterized protein (TIGR01319 family)
MRMKRALTLDIGSTWTKGALVDLDGTPRCLAHESAPTTTDDLTRGAALVLGQLLDVPGESESKRSPLPPGEESLTEHLSRLSALLSDIPLYLSSSAKGGLAIAAVGIVPELTLHAARLAAASAGGKIVGHFAYRLTPANIAALRRLTPDIVLLAGGTDGGNEQYNLHNARMLASADLPAVVIYAGNSAVQSEIAAILAGRELAIVDNLMPQIGQLVVEPAQRQVQDIFLKKIVEGKGLGELAARCASPPKPTPRAVFELMAAIAETVPEWDDTMVIDMGGATTDVYSCTESFVGQPGYVLRGLREPRLKRSVEGDLGMRVNAQWAAATGSDYVDRELALRHIPRQQFDQFIETVCGRHDYLPQGEEENACDEILAGACLYHSLGRHAGSLEESYTPDGRVLVQRGKDLRRVRRWVGSGGYLARRRAGNIERRVLAAIREDTCGARLVPESPAYFADADYLWPLLGNLAADYPAEAARLAIEHVVKIEECVSRGNGGGPSNDLRERRKDSCRRSARPAQGGA